MNKELTYATAESITGGRLQSFFTELNGSSSYFMGGICAYTTEVKVSILNVDADVAHRNNSVCKKTVEHMAKGCYSLFGADISISTTGYVQGFVFEGKKHLPEMHIAIYDARFDETHHIHHFLPEENNRAENLIIARDLALEFLKDKVA